jgi:hypothetical protein
MPDEGYDGLSKVDISLDLSGYYVGNLTATENGTYSAATRDNLYGYDVVYVNVPEKEREFNNQEKTITENGTYYPDTGYDGLSKVTVNVESDVTPTGEISITSNGTYDVTTYASANVNIPTETPDTYISFKSVSTELSSLTSLPCTFTSNCVYLGEGAMRDSLLDTRTDLDLTSVSFPNLYEIKNYGMYNTFSNCTNLTSVSFPNLSCIAESSLSGTFAYTSLTSLSFPSLHSDTTTELCFQGMLYGVTGCTVHFPSNLESVLENGWIVMSGFGGTDTVVLFDLPATE